jgi:hypothetical protein
MIKEKPNWWARGVWIFVAVQVVAQTDAWLSIRCVEVGGHFEPVVWRDLCVGGKR